MEILVILSIWQSIISIFSLIVLINAATKYIKKKTILTKNLLYTFHYYWFASLFLVLSYILSFYGYDALDRRIGAEQWLIHWPLRLISDGQVSYYLLMIGTFYLFKFCAYVYRNERQYPKSIKFARFLLIVVITFGIVSYPLEPLNLNQIAEFFYGIDLYVLIYQTLILFSMFLRSVALKKRMNENHKIYDSIKYIIRMLFFLNFLTGMYVAETIYGMLTDSFYNIFTFIGSVMVLFALYMGNRGFYKT